MAQLLEEKKLSLAQDTALYTIGYEGRSLDEFTACLKDNGVSMLVDVRAIPFSRKKGFSKTPLAQSLSEVGIEYVHLRPLGSPKELRDKVKEDGDYEFFHREYTSYVLTQTESIEELYQIVVSNNSCIMCFERDSDTCHRLDVAQEIKKRDGNGLVIKHI